MQEKNLGIILMDHYTLKSDITHAELLKIVKFDNSIGKLVWIKNTYGHAHAGKPIGGLDGDGYYCVGIKRKKYRLCRIVWLYFYGEWPNGHMDHKDGDKTNDSLNNLRIVSIKENNINRKTSKKKRKYNLPKWVMPHGKKFRSIVRANGKMNRLGVFDTPSEAHKVASEFAKTQHGEYFNDGNQI